MALLKIFFDIFFLAQDLRQRGTFTASHVDCGDRGKQATSVWLSSPKEELSPSEVSTRKLARQVHLNPPVSGPFSAEIT